MQFDDDHNRVPVWARYALAVTLLAFLLGGVLHGFPLLDGPPPKPMFWNPYEHLTNVKPGENAGPPVSPSGSASPASPTR